MGVEPNIAGLIYFSVIVKVSRCPFAHLVNSEDVNDIANNYARILVERFAKGHLLFHGLFPVSMAVGD